jgi:hypothetical protein
MLGVSRQDFPDPQWIAQSTAGTDLANRESSQGRGEREILFAELDESCVSRERAGDHFLNQLLAKLRMSSAERDVGAAANRGQHRQESGVPGMRFGLGLPSLNLSDHQAISFRMRPPLLGAIMFGKHNRPARARLFTHGQDAEFVARVAVREVDEIGLTESEIGEAGHGHGRQMGKRSPVR